MTIQERTVPSIDFPPRVDYVLLSIVIVLLAIGLIMIYSVTFMANIGQADPESQFVKQFGFAIVGLAVLFAFMKIDYRIWGRFSVPLIIITIGALGIILLMPEVNGSHRWFFGSSIQPSEIAKFTVVIYMARWLSSKGEKLRNVTYGLLPFAIFVGVVTGLIIREPNLSTAIIIGLCAMAMFFIAGADVIQYLFLLLSGGVTVALVIMNTQYQMSRWMTFLSDPIATMTRETYQIAEVLIALGSGGMFGRGLGSGLAKFGFVPAPQTDSIFALLGEEMGLIGTWAVLALFLALLYRGFRIASNTSDPFGQLLAAGLTFWLIFQAFVNIAVVTATIPFTGVPLPFISFGGSSLVMSLAAVGVLLSIALHPNAPKETHATFSFGWRNGGTRVPRVSRRRRTADARKSRQ